MKISLGKLLKTVARKAKENPEIALAVIGMAAPGLVRKAAPIIIAAATAKSAE